MPKSKNLLPKKYCLKIDSFSERLFNTCTFSNSTIKSKVIFRAYCSATPLSICHLNKVNAKHLITIYQCLSCHTIEGVEQKEIQKHAEISVVLGGNTRKTVTYAELVTSVINPSHKLASRYLIADVSTEGTSKMTVFNDVMTVTELVNLVAFLQPKYKLVPYQPTRYAYYPN